MSEILRQSTYFGLVLSLLAYGAGLALKKRFNYAVVNPLLIAIVLVMIALVAFDIDLDSYGEQTRLLSYLLTPATVCFAVPLYRQVGLLKKYPAAICGGVLSGVLSSAGSVLALCLCLGMSHEQYVTLLPKSITTAIGMGVSEELGGAAAITVAVIIVTGILGSIIAQPLLKLLKIESRLAKGLAIGASAHAVGTTKALELGEVEGAMSSLAVALCGIVTALCASFLAMLM